MSEEWRQIKEFDGKYLISNEGRVFRKRILKPYFEKGKYASFVFRHNGKYKRRYIHRLVAEAFCLKHDEAAVVNHKDGNKHNNKRENLEWCSASYNSRDAAIRLKSNLAKEEKYFEAFERYFKGDLIKNIAADMDINYRYLINIIFGCKKPHVRFWSILVFASNYRNSKG